MDRLFQTGIVRQHRGGLTWSGVLVLTFGLFGGPAVFCVAEDALPKAETILDKYVEATGGKPAYDKLQNRVSKGSMEFVGMGVKGPTIVYQARPNKFYFVFENDLSGKTEAGVTGELVWQKPPGMEPQIQKGPQRAAALREAVFDGALQWRKLYKNVECTGIETIDGKPCYKIIMTPNEGEPETHFYDKESNLLVKTRMNVETAMGTMPIESMISDYKKVDGILVAHKTVQRAGGMEMLLVTESVKHNVEIPTGAFKLPADVQALVDKEKSPKNPSTEP